MFEGTEAWCRKNGISYVRESASYREFDAERVWWMPGMKEQGAIICRNDGLDVITKQVISSILIDIEKFSRKKFKEMPLLINHKNKFTALWAKEALKAGRIEPIALFRTWLEEEYPSEPEIPTIIFV